MIENIGDAIKKFGKSRKKDTSSACRQIQTVIVSSSIRKKCLTTQLAQYLEHQERHYTNIAKSKCK